MVFSPTKMENVAQRGVLLKKQRWRGYSSPREDKEFFRKLTINTLTTGFLLVLPKFHSFDGRISPEETLVKRRMHKSEHLKGNLIILFNINLLSIQIFYCRQFQFLPLATQSMVKKPLQYGCR